MRAWTAARCSERVQVLEVVMRAEILALMLFASMGWFIMFLVRYRAESATQSW